MLFFRLFNLKLQLAEMVVAKAVKLTIICSDPKNYGFLSDHFPQYVITTNIMTNVWREFQMRATTFCSDICCVDSIYRILHPPNRRIESRKAVRHRNSASPVPLRRKTSAYTQQRPVSLNTRYNRENIQSVSQGS